MIRGIGVDIVELERIGQSVSGNPRFIERILTEKEKECFELLSDKRKVEFVAGRFAAKEAFSKAMGTGIGKEVSFLDIEILNESNGRPVLNFLSSKENLFFHLSISHCVHYAVAQVVIEER